MRQLQFGPLEIQFHRRTKPSIGPDATFVPGSPFSRRRFYHVLAWIRQKPSLRELPVMILTSSPEERDRRQAEKLGAQAYCLKPPTREMVLDVLAPLLGDLLAGPSSMR